MNATELHHAVVAVRDFHNDPAHRDEVTSKATGKVGCATCTMVDALDTAIARRWDPVRNIPLAVAEIKLGEGTTPDQAEAFANLWNAANKAEVYRAALEAIRDNSRPEIVQPRNWMKIVYEVAGAALEDPPKLVDPMTFTMDFTPTGDRPGVFTHTFENRRGPTASDLVDALAERFNVDIRIIRTEEWWRDGDDRQRREQTILRIGHTGMEAAIYFSPHEPEIVETIGILPAVAWDVARKIVAAAHSLGVEIQE